MALVVRPLLDLLRFAVFVLFFLGLLYLFVTYRVHQAYAKGDKRLYLAHADPWLPAVVALTGAGLIGILYLVK